MLTQIGVYFGLISAVYLFFRHTSAGKRTTSTIEETVFSNWRLALLGSTSVVLSLVAGYTTFDGLRNFTGGGTLSLAATFGIQGVMLVTAWLIGESFASGMNYVSQSPRGASAVNPKVQAGTGALIGVLLFVTALTLFLQTTGQVDVRNAAPADLSWSKLGDKLLVVVVGLLLAGLFALYSASDIVQPYLQGARVIIKNSMLWVMFLACMSVSVFFSFDSHFSGIFPKPSASAPPNCARKTKFPAFSPTSATRSPTRVLPRRSLYSTAKLGAPTTSKSVNSRRLHRPPRSRSSVISTTSSRIAIARSSRSKSASSPRNRARRASPARKPHLPTNWPQLEGQRPGLAAEFAEKKSALDARAKEVDAKRVEAMAEDRGVEGTGKVGRGPMYRQRVDELGKLQDYLKIGEERVKDAQKRLAGTETRIAQIKRELAAIDGDLAKLQG